MALKLKVKRLVFVVAILHGFFLTVSCEESCMKAMKKAKIIPEYAEQVKSTDLKICCNYTEFQCDQNYSPALMETPPDCYYNVKDTSCCPYVTIMFFGKCSVTGKTILSWLVHNVPAADLKNGFNGQSGRTVVPYKKPDNYQVPADHMFFVYCQPEYENDFFCISEDAKNFNVKEYRDTHGLNDPEAGKCFKVTAMGQLMHKLRPNIDKSKNAQ